MLIASSQLFGFAFLKGYISSEELRFLRWYLVQIAPVFGAG